MPRSFLVKKVKLDTFSSADLESSYGRARSDLGVRLQEKGASWDGAGGWRARGSVLEGVEGHRVGLEGPGAPGNRLGRNQNQQEAVAEEDLGGDGGRERGTQRQARTEPRLGSKSVDAGENEGNRGQEQEEHTDPRPVQHRMDPADMTGPSNVCRPHSENSLPQNPLLFFGCTSSLPC